MKIIDTLQELIDYYNNHPSLKHRTKLVLYHGVTGENKYSIRIDNANKCIYYREFVNDDKKLEDLFSFDFGLYGMIKLVEIGEDFHKAVEKGFIKYYNDNFVKTINSNEKQIGLDEQKPITEDARIGDKEGTKTTKIQDIPFVT